MTLHWHTEPLLLLVLLVPSWLYALWMGPYRPAGMRFPVGRAVAFYLGIAITYLTVGSPTSSGRTTFFRRTWCSTCC